jgi:hypothetical protein
MTVVFRGTGMKILGFAVAASLLVLAPHTAGSTENLQQLCENFGASMREKPPLKNWPPHTEIKFFFNDRTDTCLATASDLLDNNWMIYDLQRRYLKDMWAIFHCDRDGIDNAHLDRIEAHNGFMMDVPYREYLDNGKGEAPRALKTPAKPYDREQCREAFTRKMEELKLPEP